VSSDLDLDFDLVAAESRHARHDSVWARLLRRIDPVRRTSLTEGFTVKAKFRPADCGFEFLGSLHATPRAAEKERESLRRFWRKSPAGWREFSVVCVSREVYLAGGGRDR
jgi:hypothetical protein